MKPACRRSRIFSVTVLAAALAAAQAQAFCGFYVGKADAKLFNEASQVIMARDGLIAAYGSNSQEIKLLFSPLILTGAAIRFFIVYELAPKVRTESCSPTSQT